MERVSRLVRAERGNDGVGRAEDNAVLEVRVKQVSRAQAIRMS